MTDDPVGTGWTPPRTVQEVAERIYFQDPRLPDLDPLTAGVHRGFEDEPPNASTYDDALFDLTRLLDEVRFETAVGALYSLGLNAELQAQVDQLPSQFGYGMPPRVLAFLSGFVRADLPPSMLLTHPEAPIAGLRVLGGWWAAQLFDSAMLRSLASLDRIATLLFCAAGEQIDPDRAPAFRSGTMRRLRSWSGPDWEALLALLDNPIFDFVKGYRDGFIHRKRTPMVLHGDHAVIFDPAQGGVQGITADDHLALVIAFFREVLAPALEIAGRLILEVVDPLEDGF